MRYKVAIKKCMARLILPMSASAVVTWNTLLNVIFSSNTLLLMLTSEVKSLTIHYLENISFTCWWNLSRIIRSELHKILSFSKKQSKTKQNMLMTSKYVSIFKIVSMLVNVFNKCLGKLDNSCFKCHWLHFCSKSYFDGLWGQRFELKHTNDTQFWWNVLWPWPWRSFHCLCKMKMH